MRVAICDDDSLELARVTGLLTAYQAERVTALTYRTYTSATELLATMKQGMFDLLLLDIIMPGFSGIEAAQEIRTFDPEVPIIFLTASTEYALESYGVKALDYLLKPVAREKLFASLDEVSARAQSAVAGLTVKTQGGIARILFHKLVFVEVRSKHIYFHLDDGAVREVSASLAEFEDRLLAHPGFVKTHRSYIVNLSQMRELTANFFIGHLNQAVPISRLLYRQVRQAYLDSIFAAP